MSRRSSSTSPRRPSVRSISSALRPNRLATRATRSRSWALADWYFARRVAKAPGSARSGVSVPAAGTPAERDCAVHGPVGGPAGLNASFTSTASAESNTAMASSRFIESNVSAAQGLRPRRADRGATGAARGILHSAGRMSIRVERRCSLFPAARSRTRLGSVFGRLPGKLVRNPSMRYSANCGAFGPIGKGLPAD